ncbi:MAG: amidohydrolase family protein [Boseongicola sp.]
MAANSTDKAPPCAPADYSPHIPGFAVPVGSCDCHAHIFGTASALVKNRAYTPPEANLSAYQDMLRTTGLSRGVIVQPSVYGTDNRTTLQAVAEGGENFRAIVVVNEDVTQHELQTLHAQGARGARVNALFQSDVSLENLQMLARTLADVNWHMQMLVDVSEFANLESFVRALPIPVVFDHMGHIPASYGSEHPGFQALLRLVGEGQAWAKLLGSYRMTGQRHPPYDDVAPFAEGLVRANPDQLVWASDWPHPHIPTPMPNDGDLLDMLADWVVDTKTRNKILVDNPARLYGFGLPTN